MGAALPLFKHAVLGTDRRLFGFKYEQRGSPPLVLLRLNGLGRVEIGFYGLQAGAALVENALYPKAIMPVI